MRSFHVCVVFPVALLSLALIRRFLPTYCPERVKVSLMRDGETPPKKLPANDAGEMLFHTWLQAWEGYSLTAAALGQLTYNAAQGYKHLVAKIAREAAPKHTEALGVIYDRLLRFVSRT